MNCMNSRVFKEQPDHDWVNFLAFNGLIICCNLPGNNSITLLNANCNDMSAYSPVLAWQKV